MYKFQGKIVYNIDENGDNFKSFDIVVELIKKKDILINDYYAGGWDTSYMNFIICGIKTQLLFRDFGGTELSIDENVSEENLTKIECLVDELINAVNKKSEQD